MRRIARLEGVRERLDLALHACEARAEYRHVDDEHRHEDPVGAGYVLARLVEGQGGRGGEQLQHHRAPTNTRSAPLSSRASSLRRRRRRWSLALFEVSSSLQSVMNSSEMAT